MKALLLAAMPVVMDGNALDLDHWLRIEPAIAAAVECRQPLSMGGCWMVLRPIPPVTGR